jgi:hypothetical protein
MTATTTNPVFNVSAGHQDNDVVLHTRYARIARMRPSLPR